MVRKLKDLRKNKKGFTLVELIVVLVILGILIALLVPSLTGYIKKADQKVVLAEARSAQMAVQSLAADKYNSGTGNVAWTSNDNTAAIALAEVNGTISDVAFAQGVLTTMTYQNAKYTAKYAIPSGQTKAVWTVAN